MSYSTLEKNDMERRKIIHGIVKKHRGKFSGEDYFFSTIPFLHSKRITHLRIAFIFAKKSLSLGYPRAKRLCEAVEDRICVIGGKDQKHGTQFIKKKNTWVKYKSRT